RSKPVASTHSRVSPPRWSVCAILPMLCTIPVNISLSQQQAQIAADLTLIDHAQALRPTNRIKRRQFQQRPRLIAEQDRRYVQQYLVGETRSEQCAAQGRACFDLELVDAAFGERAQHVLEIQTTLAHRRGGEFHSSKTAVRGPRVRLVKDQGRRG